MYSVIWSKETKRKKKKYKYFITVLKHIYVLGFALPDFKLLLITFTFLLITITFTFTKRDQEGSKQKTGKLHRK